MGFSVPERVQMSSRVFVRCDALPTYYSILIRAVCGAQSQLKRRQGTQAAKIQRVLAEGLARGVVRDRVLRDGNAVSILWVDVSSDLQVARIYWEPTQEGSQVRPLQRALQRRRGQLVQYITSFVRQRIAPRLEFHPVPEKESDRLSAIFEELRIQAQVQEQHTVGSIPKREHAPKEEHALNVRPWAARLLR